MTRRPLQITAFIGPNSNFAKMVRRLPPRMQRELERVIDELCAGELASGRNLERLRIGNNLYSVRLNRNFRLVFEIMDNGIGRAIAVGPHDKAYEAAERSQQ